MQIYNVQVWKQEINSYNVRRTFQELQNLMVAKCSFNVQKFHQRSTMTHAFVPRVRW